MGCNGAGGSLQGVSDEVSASSQVDHGHALDVCIQACHDHAPDACILANHDHALGVYSQASHDHAPSFSSEVLASYDVWGLASCGALALGL